MNSDESRPTVWPPPPDARDPEPQSQPTARFGNEQLGALSPACVALGFVPSSGGGILMVGGFILVLVGFILGALSWRTFGGKLGIVIALVPVFLLMVILASSQAD